MANITINQPINTYVLIHKFSFTSDGLQKLTFTANLGEGEKNNYTAKADVAPTFRWQTKDENNLSALDGSHSVVFKVTLENVENAWRFTSLTRVADNKEVINKPTDILAKALANLTKAGVING